MELGPAFSREELDAFDPQRLTLETAWNLYIQRHIIRQKVSDSYIRMCSYMRDKWKKSFPGLMLWDIRGDMAEHMIAVFSEGGQKGSNLRKHGPDGKPLQVQRGTLVKYHNFLVSMLRWMMKYDLLDPNIYFTIKAVSVPRSYRGYPTIPRALVTDSELEDVLAVEPTESARDIWAMLNLIGGRPRDVFMMRLNEIDMDGVTWIYDIEKHKTSRLGRNRTIALGPKAREILKRQMSKKHSPGGTLFRNDEGKSWDRDSLAEKLKVACANAGVKRFTMKDLRTKHSNRVNTMYGPEVEAILLGHTPDIAARHYIRKEVAVMISVAEEIG